jgi:hypothetical protein
MESLRQIGSIVREYGDYTEAKDLRLRYRRAGRGCWEQAPVASLSSQWGLVQ